MPWFSTRSTACSTTAARSMSASVSCSSSTLRASFTASCRGWALLRLLLHRDAHFLAYEADRGLGQVADDALHVAADVAHFGELGRLDLDERRPDERREPSRDLGLPHAGGADEDDVFGRHV